MWKYELGKFLVLKYESKDAIFDHTYLDKSYLSSNINNIVGSCNGLVCLSTFHMVNGTKIILWNPATREFTNIPDVTFPTNVFSASGPLGFGFDKNSKDYKLVRIMKSLSTNIYNYNVDKIFLHPHVFTRGSNCWRSLKPVKGWIWNENRTVLVNGILYWTGLTPQRESCIWSFNLRDEEFRTIEQLPADFGDAACDYRLDLCKWKDSILAALTTPKHIGSDYYFWQMSSLNSRLNFSWTKLFIISGSLGYLNFCGVWMDQLLFKKDFVEAKVLQIWLCDPIKGIDRKMLEENDCKREKWFYKLDCVAHDYVPSLVSVHTQPDDSHGLIN